MRKVAMKGTKDLDKIDTLYRMVEMNMDFDKIADWLGENGHRYSNALIKQTFKEAKREDLVDYFIKEEDVSIGDTVKSRATGRTGTVKGIKNDGDTIVVAWETGGTQMVSKEGMFKLKGKAFVKIHTELDPYGDIN